MKVSHRKIVYVYVNDREANGTVRLQEVEVGMVL